MKTILKERLEIHWDTKKRVLCVQDNGTGMTQRGY